MFKKLIVSKTLRQRTSWIVAGLLILPFILFFHATGRTPNPGPGGTAGVIFGKEIPWEEFQRHQRWLAQQWENRFGDTLPEALRPFLNQSTWDRLILVEEARHRRVRVADQDVAALIQGIAAFHEQGRFRPERYHQFLRATGSSPQLFEGLLRTDLILEKLISLTKATVTVTEDEVKAAYVTAHEQRRASVFVFDQASYRLASAEHITDQNLQTYYDAHPEAFRIPEQLRLEYAGVARDEIAARTPSPTDEELRGFYDEHGEEFRAQDGTLAPLDDIREVARQHWLDERVTKALTTHALDLQDDLEAGLRFEEISAARGLTVRTVGPLPVEAAGLSEGVDPAILQAVATLPVGTMSAVVQTGQGVYIARPIERVPARHPSLEEVHQRVRDLVIDEQARAAARAAAEALHRRLNEQIAAGLRFEEAVLAAEHLPVFSAQFTRSQPIEPVGTAPAVNEAAFNTALGSLTEVIEVPAGFVFVRPEAAIPADTTRFADIRATLRDETLTQKQSAYLDQWLIQVRTRAKLRSFVDDVPPS